jgi:hypothetical protein
MKLRPAFLLLAIALLASKAEALTAVGNGNYFISFTDLEHPVASGVYQLKVQRTYNSRSQYEGIYGYGWGSDNEAFLVPSPDGSATSRKWWW